MMIIVLVIAARTTVLITQGTVSIVNGPNVRKSRIHTCVINTKDNYDKNELFMIINCVVKWRVDWHL